MNLRKNLDTTTFHVHDFLFFSQDDAKENRKLFEGLDIERAGEKYM